MKRLLRLLVAVPLFLLSPFSFAQSRKSVAEHKARLPRVAVNFVNIFADKFPNAFKSIHILEEFLAKTHDVVKQMPVRELEKFDYEWEEDVLTRLRYYSNVKREEMSEGMREEFEHFREEFNRIENEIKVKFFENRGIGIGSPLALEIRVVETIVDVTDTGIFRRREIGIRNEKPYNGAEYLLSHGFPKLWASLSRTLEDNYDELLQASFIPLPKFQGPACRSTFGYHFN